MKRCALLLSKTILITLIIAELAVAQSVNGGIMVRPLKINLSAPPGAVSSGEIVLENTSSKAVAVLLDAQDVIKTKNGETYDELAEDDLDSVFRWITFDEARVSIGPGATRRVKYRIEVPFGRKAGRYDAAIFVSEDSGQKNQKGVNISGRIGIKASIQVQPLSKAEIFAIDLEGEWLARPKFLVKIKNEGSVDVSPTGRLIIKKIPEDGGEITQSFKSASITPGKEGVASINGIKGLSGRYKVIATLDGCAECSDEFEFYLPSLWLLSLLVVSLFGLLVSTIFLIKFSLRR